MGLPIQGAGKPGMTHIKRAREPKPAKMVRAEPRDKLL